MEHFFRRISFLSCLFVGYQVSHLCRYGGVKRHLVMIIPGIMILFFSFVLWLVLKRNKKDEIPKREADRKVLKLEAAVVVIGSLIFMGQIVYSALPYHGALSWKIEEWMNQKKIELKHNQVFQDGVEGIFEDLDQELGLPEKLYLTNKFQLTFDEHGTIQTIYTYFYGLNEHAEARTYLVDYDAKKSPDMTVWVDHVAGGSYEEDKLLEPMFCILDKADVKEQVKAWAAEYDSAVYEILYWGRRSFATADGLKILPGDADGDGIDTGDGKTQQLLNGGEMLGFEVSLHIPAIEQVTPVRYMMEPKYISAELLEREREEEQVDAAIRAERWTADPADGSMYFFADDSVGWRMIVTDAATGSRYYELEKTTDGGKNWERINRAPFGTRMGVVAGLLFFDENIGFAGLTGASQTFAEVYRTEDGGKNFELIHLPIERVTDLPESAKKFGYQLEEYDYIEMPESDNGRMIIKVVLEAGEQEGLLFESLDNGETWSYAGNS